MINFVLIFSFISTIIYISRARQANNQIDYITAGKQTKVFSLISTLVMTEINPMALIAMCSLGYTAGYWSLSMAFIAFIAPLFAALTTSKKWKQFDSTCVSFLFDKYLGYDIGNIVRAILLSSLMILSATYLKGIIIFSKIMFPKFPPPISILMVLVFCVFSVIRKGLSGIIRMDVIGFFIMTIFSIMCLSYGFIRYFYHQSNFVGTSTLFNFSVLPLKYLIALLVLQLMMYSIAPWWGQKIFAANNTATAYTASICASLLLFIFYSAMIFSAIFLKKYGVILKQPETTFPVMLLTFVPSKLNLFYIIAFFYIATTTICGVWSSMLGVITSGFLQKSNEDSPKINYVIWVMLGIINYYFALHNIENVLHGAVLAVMQMSSIYFSVIAIFFLKRISRVGSLVSIFSSITIGYIFLFYFGEERNYIWHWVIIGVPTMFISGYLFSGISNVFLHKIRRF